MKSEVSSEWTTTDHARVSDELVSLVSEAVVLSESVSEWLNQ